MIVGSNSAISIYKFKIMESDSVYFTDIKDIIYSPKLEYFVVNQNSYSNRINIFDTNSTLYKSYLIDDSYTDKYLDLIIQLPESDTVLTTNALRKVYGDSKNIYGNTISKSVFVNDSILATIGILNYFKFSKSNYNNTNLRSYNTVVLFIINIHTDIIEVTPLNYITQKLYPQASLLKCNNEFLYFTLLPMGLIKNFPDSPNTTLGKIKLGEENWETVIDLPKEYLESNVKLGLDYNYRIASFNSELYFLSPYTNYAFNLKKDTIWLSDLNDPIESSLNKHNLIRVSSKEDYPKLDSLSHKIGDLFFLNFSLYVLIIKPKDYDNKIYLNKYTLNGELIYSNVINENQKIETVFYSENKQKLYKVYMKNEEWWVEEIDFD